MFRSFKHINRFVVAILIFIIWIVFVDDNSLLYLHRLDKDIKELEKQKEFYRKGIQEQKQALKNLNDKQKLQKYAREKLLMKKEDEDIYIIETKK